MPQIAKYLAKIFRMQNISHNTVSRPCINQYLFYYNFLKVDKEENYQRLHEPLLYRMLPWLHQITSFLFYPSVKKLRIWTLFTQYKEV